MNYDALQLRLVIRLGVDKHGATVGPRRHPWIPGRDFQASAADGGCQEHESITGVDNESTGSSSGAITFPSPTQDVNSLVILP